MIDADRNWEARQDSLAAERAMAMRERRQAETLTLIADVGGWVLTCAIVAWGFSKAHEAGLFSFLSSNQ